LPMIIDRANRKLHQHGLHLIMHEKGACYATGPTGRPQARTRKSYNAP
jgi:hypothetical protein